ncbi:hypothetical protein, partial [Methylicorpusculum sp.]|uniref:hypothetical protein n=1 Tax=Methylicorpusculum sp. TaxID=2713644 RepID=UPI002ABB25E7
MFSSIKEWWNEWARFIKFSFFVNRSVAIGKWYAAQSNFKTFGARQRPVSAIKFSVKGWKIAGAVSGAVAIAAI